MKQGPTAGEFPSLKWRKQFLLAKFHCPKACILPKKINKVFELKEITVEKCVQVKLDKKVNVKTLHFSRLVFSVVLFSVEGTYKHSDLLLFNTTNVL